MKKNISDFMLSCACVLSDLRAEKSLNWRSRQREAYR